MRAGGDGSRDRLLLARAIIVSHNGVALRDARERISQLVEVLALADDLGVPA
jgi:hypothetical protein